MKNSTDRPRLAVAPVTAVPGAQSRMRARTNQENRAENLKRTGNCEPLSGYFHLTKDVAPVVSE